MTISTIDFQRNRRIDFPFQNIQIDYIKLVELEFMPDILIQ